MSYQRLSVAKVNGKPCESAGVRDDRAEAAAMEFLLLPSRCDFHGRAEREADQCGQATKGTWGMSWRQEALKGVEDCEKLGEAVKQALIPRSLNYRAPNP